MTETRLTPQALDDLLQRLVARRHLCNLPGSHGVAEVAAAFLDDIANALRTEREARETAERERDALVGDYANVINGQRTALEAERDALARALGRAWVAVRAGLDADAYRAGKWDLEHAIEHRVHELAQQVEALKQERDATAAHLRETILEERDRTKERDAARRSEAIAAQTFDPPPVLGSPRPPRDFLRCLGPMTRPTQPLEVRQVVGTAVDLGHDVVDQHRGPHPTGGQAQPAERFLLPHPSRQPIPVAGVATLPTGAAPVVLRRPACPAVRGAIRGAPNQLRTPGRSALAKRSRTHQRVAPTEPIRRRARGREFGLAGMMPLAWPLRHGETPHARLTHRTTHTGACRSCRR